MTIDFRKTPTVISPALINNQAMESVQQYKYPGTVFDDKLTFELQVGAAF